MCNFDSPIEDPKKICYGNRNFFVFTIIYITHNNSYLCNEIKIIITKKVRLRVLTAGDCDPFLNCASKMKVDRMANRGAIMQ